MLPIQLHSEPYSRDGNLAADGAVRLLGQPDLTPLELVIREALQNSWDASLDCDGTPVFGIRVRILDAEHLQTMRDFFRQLPPAEADEPVAAHIRRFLESPQPTVMEISDERTKGLGGPVSASQALRDGESADFVNFVRNIGSARDLVLGGGTYGFGKSSLFRISRCSTVIIHTLTGPASSPEHRLIAKALGMAFDHAGRRYTGRHWWGIPSDEIPDGDSVDPAFGELGFRIAEALGMPERRSAEQRGTTLMILDPELEDLRSDEGQPPSTNDGTRRRLMARIQDMLLWHCWPKFTAREDGSFPMECRLSILGEQTELPDPATIQPLWLLTQALQEARRKTEEVFCERPMQRIGFFGQCQASLQLHADDRYRIHLGDESLIPEKLCHMALLRPAELVVRYQVGSLNVADQTQWGAVFICDRGPENIVEQAYARSEPPAHDDWQPKADQSLTRHQRTYVNVGLTRIKERVKQLSGTDIARTLRIREREQESLAALAGELGRSLIGTGPGGADGGTPAPRGSGGRRPLRLSTPSALGTELRDGSPVATFRLRLTGDSDEGALISLTPWVQSDVREREAVAPNGTSPEIVAISFDGQELDAPSTRISCRPSTKGVEILVSLRVPDYVAVGLTAELVEEDQR
jgi:hypothetical protein